MERRAGIPENYDLMIKKGIWHSIRIAIFGLQFKEHQKIVDFTAANKYLKDILNDKTFNPNNYINLRDYYHKQLKK